MSHLEARWLGRIGYRDARAQQVQHREGVIAGHKSGAFWLLEHDPVITTGRRRVDDLPPAHVLEQSGIDLVETERGGLATYHGPGQLVGYLIVDLHDRPYGVRGFVERLESGIINWLAGLEVEARRRAGYPGVWVGGDKICAVGLHIRKGVTLHGFALNLSTDLAPFSLFTPCGIADAGVTTLARLRTEAPMPEEAAFSVAESVAEALEVELTLAGSDRPR